MEAIITYIPDDDKENTFTIDLEELRLIALVDRTHYEYNSPIGNKSSITLSYDGRVIGKIESYHDSTWLSKRDLWNSILENTEVIEQIFMFSPWSK